MLPGHAVWLHTGSGRGITVQIPSGFSALEVGCEKEGPLTVRAAHLQGARGGQNLLIDGLGKWGSSEREKVCKKT